MGKVERAEELQKFRENLFLGKKIRMTTETSIIEGTVIAIESSTMFLQDVKHKFISRISENIVAEGDSKYAEIFLGTKPIFLID